jgi:uncharacterized protein YukE
MPEVGADVEALDRLGRGFQFEATVIQTEIIDWVESSVNETWWKGKDAEAFKLEWQDLKAALRNVAQRFEQVGAGVRRQAEEQRAASES